MTQSYSAFLRTTALFLLIAINAATLPVSASDRAKSLTDDQKVIHLLNRIGFGARPGDVERVRAIGIQRYLEEQLSPEKIDDSTADSKIRDLEILRMETPEIFAKYPNPGALLRMLEGSGGRNLQNAEMEKMSDDDQQKMRRERRQKLTRIYQEYDLRPANQILRDISASRILRAVYSERQLEEQMVDFWTNHFNVFAGKGAVRWYLPSYDRDVIRKYALGNFKDLLTATAQHPAMLFYLDNFQSVSPNAQINANNRGNRRANDRRTMFEGMIRDGKLPENARRRIKEQTGLSDAELDQRLRQMQNNQGNRRGINENYAREIMELHTLGVDGGYTQKDIQEVARAFTGWTIADARGYRNAAAMMIKGEKDDRTERQKRRLGIPNDVESGEFYFNPRLHDNGEKIVLGQKINEGGIKDGLKVIDILVKNRSTARFIARKLAVKFVSDNPGEAIVEKAANAFQSSGGDIKSTLRAIFASEEFYAPENYKAKIKTPFELMVSSFRALGAETNASPAVIGLLQKMGEPLYGYQAPTGYPDSAEDWVNTGALLERMNFAVAFSANQIRGTRVNLKNFEANAKPEILNKAIAVILNGEIAPSTRSALLKQIEQPLMQTSLDEDENEVLEMNDAMPAGNRRNLQNRRNQLLPPSGNAEVFKVVGLLLGSPDFQRQ